MLNTLFWNYCTENWLELSGFIIALFSIYFQIKQKPIYWPISIVMVSLYIFIFYQSKFYADMSLQFYYLIVSFYGWYFWIFGNRKSIDENKNVGVAKTSTRQKIFLILLTILFFIAISFILIHFTDSPLPYGDAFTTALSFTATWLLAKKYIENWIFWLIVNPVSVGLYVYKELYLTAALFIILTILAVVGYYQWKKDLINEEIA